MQVQDSESHELKCYRLLLKSSKTRYHFLVEGTKNRYNRSLEPSECYLFPCQLALVRQRRHASKNIPFPNK